MPKVEYSYYRCGQCKLTFVSQLPPEEHLRRYYESDAYSLAPPKSPYWLECIRRLQMKLARPIPVKSPGKLLDFGCGDGAYLAFAQSYGWQTTGVEYSAKTAQRAKARGFHVLLPSELDTLPDNAFDLITMIHSLEHVLHPVETFHQMVHKLTPTGTLFVEIPYLDCHEFNLLGRHYAMLQPPLHLQFFSDITMEWLRSSCGLDLIEAKNNLWTPMYYTRSLLNLLGHRFGFTIDRKQQILISTLAFPLTFIPALLTSRLGMNGSVRQYRFVKPMHQRA